MTRSLAFHRFAVPEELPAGTWTGPWVEPGFEHPRGDPVLERARRRRARSSRWSSRPGRPTATRPAGTRSAAGRSTTTRSSARRFPGQEDAFGSVATDTFRAAASLVAYRLRLTLTAAGHGLPVVRLLGAIASSAAPAAGDVSAPGVAAGVELDVPPYAQTHPPGEYPAVRRRWRRLVQPGLDGDGDGRTGARARRPPTSSGSIRRSPTPASITRRASPSTRPTTARATGPSTPPTPRTSGSTRSSPACARCRRPSCSSPPASRSSPRSPRGRASSTASCCRRARPGISSSSSASHAEGDPIVNDPAAPSNDAVRRSYDRAQFERVWLEGSGGAVYVITPPGTALPPSPGNW